MFSRTASISNSRAAGRSAKDYVENPMALAQHLTIGCKYPTVASRTVLPTYVHTGQS